MGQTVPENRNRGRMPSRMIMENGTSLSWVATKAASGVSRFQMVTLFHMARKTNASRSATRILGGVVTRVLVLEGPGGEGQEDVLQRAAAHEDGRRLQALGPHLLLRRVTVGGVHEDA